MTFNKIKKFILAGCMAAAVAFTGCMSVGDIYDITSGDQTSQNGDENKDKDDKNKDKEEKDGYDVSYSGKISGKASQITVYGADNSVIGKGAGEFEWLGDNLVKVTFDKKDKDNNSVILIADQQHVIIKMLKENGKIKSDDSKKDASDNDKSDNK